MARSLQNDLSPQDWTIMYHEVTHMEEQLKRWGPVKDQWMYPLEDFFGYSMSCIKTRSFPVASMLKQDAATVVLTVAKELIQSWHRPRGMAYDTRGRMCIFIVFCYRQLLCIEYDCRYC